jgi:hypothetical protein
MIVSKIFKITIEQVKKDTIEMTMNGTSLVSVLDEVREMVKQRNATNKRGNVFSIKKIEEQKGDDSE